MALASDLLSFLSPKGKTGRIGFWIIFLCGIVFVHFAFGVLNWLVNWHNAECFEFHVWHSLSIWATLFGLFGGCIPLAVLFLIFVTTDCFMVGPSESYDYFYLAIVVDIMFLLYVFQCVRRCHDMGRSRWFCMIPLFNPYALLFCKSKETRNSENE